MTLDMTEMLFDEIGAAEQPGHRLIDDLQTLKGKGGFANKSHGLGQAVAFEAKRNSGSGGMVVW